MLKRLVLPLALAAATAAVLPAQAQVTDCGMSVMVLPNGECLDMDYITVLGASRRNVGEANAIYNELFDTNVRIEMIYSEFPQLDNETEEERRERYESLLRVRDGRDAVAASGQSVEDKLFPVHVRAMNAVGRAYR